MNLEFLYQVFLCGAFGGFLGELLKWYRIRESGRWPDYARGLFYWIITGLMITSGGVLAVLHSGSTTSALVAVNIGISAPLLIQTVGRSMHATGSVSPPGPGDHDSTERRSSVDFGRYLDKSQGRKFLDFLAE